jgi:hypothetical protein
MSNHLTYPVNPLRAGCLWSEQQAGGLHQRRGAFEPVLQQLVGCLRLLLRGALLFILAGFISAMLPFQPWQAMWYLRIGQTGFEYGITTLFAFALAILVEFFEPDVDRAILRRMRLLTGANIAAVFLRF